ncbi:MAG: nucleotidyltransferase family protein [Myxococcales bacterium]|nr:nucleotidyltransferase family protein [Myxococcales bacterium]
MAARASLLTVLTVLDRAGIRALPVKGVVTGAWLYGDPSERPLTDLDVRVAPRDLDRAEAALAAAGFQFLAGRSPTGNVVVEVGGVMVDLETHAGPPGLGRLTVEQMLDRATTRATLGFPTLWPDPVDHALLLTINVFKDKIALAAPWSLEDARRVVRAPEVGRAAFVDGVRRAKIAQIAWLVADAMARAGDDEWRRIRDDLGPPPRRVHAAMSRWLERRPASTAARLVARVAGDGPLDWARGMRAAAQIELWKLRDPVGSVLRF